MTHKLILGAASIIIALGMAQVTAHTICDEYGRCWEQPADPGDAIGDAIVHGIFGHHHGDWDHHDAGDWDHHDEEDGE